MTDLKPGPEMDLLVHVALGKPVTDYPCTMPPEPRLIPPYSTDDARAVRDVLPELRTLDRIGGITFSEDGFHYSYAPGAYPTLSETLCRALLVRKQPKEQKPCND